MLIEARYGVLETTWVNPNQPQGVYPEIFHLSHAQDLRWAGLVLLPAGAGLLSDEDIRNDIYVVRGSLVEEGVTGDYSAETYLTRVNPRIQGGSEGATLFVYQDHYAEADDQITKTKKHIEWQQGGVRGMRIAPLIDDYYRLMLVSWSPNTNVPYHDHPRGEEIFVLKGELQDQRGRYPAGTWQRLHPGTGHSPHVTADTLILLRNGHLRK